LKGGCVRGRHEASGAFGVHRAAHSLVAKKVGVGGYGYQRLKKATEDEKYPKLLYSYDAESLQEKIGGEKGKQRTDGDNGGNE